MFIKKITLPKLLQFMFLAFIFTFLQTKSVLIKCFSPDFSQKKISNYKKNKNNDKNLVLDFKSSKSSHGADEIELIAYLIDSDGTTSIGTFSFELTGPNYQEKIIGWAPQSFSFLAIYFGIYHLKVIDRNGNIYTKDFEISDSKLTNLDSETLKDSCFLNF